MSDKATPRPWRVARGFISIAVIADSEALIIDGGGSPDIAWVPPIEGQRANADLIVRAVNAHDALVAVARLAMTHHAMERNAATGGASRHCACDLCHAARAALKLAGVEHG